MGFMDLWACVAFVLSQDKTFCQDGKLFKNAVVEAALKPDPRLLRLLIGDERTKDHFFTEVADTLVFDPIKFQKFVSNKQFLPDSYTAFKNKIGLTVGGAYLTEGGEVVLSWPYKDCVLAGGQTKADSKRQEIFWNETLAPDEIDRLFEPKVLTNWKRCDKGGEHRVKELSITDNFIIKGNNLIALHSLKKVYRGKVKLIYIDPPYNTGNDSFQYNDSFNHSTWLAFMKNRLTVARALLRADGVIFVQCDDNEQAYLKVLMDEVFGRENFVNTIIVKMSETSGVKMSHVSKRLPKTKEEIHLFVKDKGKISLNEIRVQKQFSGKDFGYLSYYNKIISNYDGEGVNYRNWQIENIQDYLKKQNIKFKTNEEKINFYLDNSHRIIYRTNNKSFAKIEGIERLKTSTGLDKFNWDGKEMLFLKDHIKEALCDLWTDISTINLNKEGIIKMNNGKKPEALIQRIIEIATQPGDLVLDYHLGSGTTAAVAHKMGRRYIGIEQMDYIARIPVVRLKKVTAGEPGGISKKVGWTGGGSFVYCELAQNTERYKKAIQNADDDEALELWRELKQSPYVSYRVDFQKANTEEFTALPLADKKEILKSLIDKNTLYIPYADRADADYKVSEADKALTNKFYGLRTNC